MTDDIDREDVLRGGEVLRLATLAVGSIQIIGFLLFAHLKLQSLDPLGSSADESMGIAIALPLLLFTIPGLLLAWLGRAPRIAHALVWLALPVAGVLWA
ncbi:MAG: hypothetical protein JNN24_18235 [Hyphomicrobium zavarzinii]|jgi:hypothetical protein|uniref:hypothetical protein n=1 Tax=Hyphomicrobium TaxID=81 RepID=UPI00036EF3B5|nr:MULTISPECIES: hypothetical protein [Hyphomicrobium]MBL8847706.1 hypothetical protein [Hyphomicrobium zavarzinii]WBT38234.1 hypothetical protein PE058_21700 [Hyphomicrobium sp. DMF-1]